MVLINMSKGPACRIFACGALLLFISYALWIKTSQEDDLLYRDTNKQISGKGLSANQASIRPSVEKEHKFATMAGEFSFVRQVNPEFANISVDAAREKFISLLTTFPVKCSKQSRLGKEGDGGYTVCLDEPFAPEKNKCLVYSFGIKNEWSFDDDLYGQYGCEVHSFDPSMKQEDHMHSPGVRFHNLGIWGSDTISKDNWKLMSLTNIIKTLGHTKRKIDVLKIDVEGAEWPVLQEMLETNSIQQVKQMIFEIHTPKFPGEHLNQFDYGQIYDDLEALQLKLGFQLYKENHVNRCCRFYAWLYRDKASKKAYCCYELFYLNSKYQ